LKAALLLCIVVLSIPSSSNGEFLTPSKQNDKNSTESTGVETNHNSLDGHGDIDSDIASTVPNGDGARHKRGTTAPSAEA